MKCEKGSTMRIKTRAIRQNMYIHTIQPSFVSYSIVLWTVSHHHWASSQRKSRGLLFFSFFVYLSLKNVLGIFFVNTRTQRNCFSFLPNGHSHSQKLITRWVKFSAGQQVIIKAQALTLTHIHSKKRKTLMFTNNVTHWPVPDGDNSLIF